MIEMIHKVNIANFGTYKNFIWDEHLVNNYPYKSRRINESLKHNGLSARNVIFGRNYSGKTTLSRIFRSLQLGKIHNDYTESDYEFVLDEGAKISSNQLPEYPHISVYNSDFRKENLAFFYNEDQNISPFSIIGTHNVELKNEIRIIESDIVQLSKIIEGDNQHVGLLKEYEDIKSELVIMIRLFNNHLTDTAGKIRLDYNAFKADTNMKIYDKRHLEQEINSAKALDDVRFKVLKAFLLEENKKILPMITIPDFNIKYFVKAANDLINCQLTPSKALEALIIKEQDKSWIQQGHYLHQNESECKFCGSKLETERMQQLNQIFNDQSKKYEQELENLLLSLMQAQKQLEEYKLDMNGNELYKQFQLDFNEVNKNFNQTLREIKHFLSHIIKEIENKKSNLFSLEIFLPFEDVYSNSLLEIEKSFNEIIKENTKVTNEYEVKQKDAREAIRFHIINEELNRINYYSLKLDIQNLQDRYENAEETLKKNQEQLEKFQDLKKSKEDMMSNEDNAIQVINFYLSRMRDSNDLELRYYRSDPGGHFQVYRHNQLARNLSEGEQTIIAFCYFLAQLSNLTQEQIEQHIVFIDDPMSSLDSNHTFYIFSLIDVEISQKEYKQLIISTHSLDFLKYMHKLKGPSTNEKYILRQFILDRQSIGPSETTSIVNVMPAYLREYTTEFIYLFHQIYRVASEEQSDSNYQVFYNFPNSCRKFLESYLFFQWPDSSLNNDQRINRFFSESGVTISFIGRINNEFSHLENNPDRAFNPIDIPEFKNNALTVLSTIKQRNEEQYESFLSSLGLEDII